MLKNLAALSVLSLLSLSACGAEPAVSVPAPSFDPRGTATGTQTAVLAGGCFWGVQGVYQHLRPAVSAERRITKPSAVETPATPSRCRSSMTRPR